VTTADEHAAHLDVARIVEVLNRHDVDYVVIGGVAAEAWAESVGLRLQPTIDIDVTPDTNQGNLDRLSEALDDLQARIRTDAVPEGLPFSHDGASLGRAAMWNLICPAGPFDISFVPSGTNGFTDFAERARVVLVEGLETPLADLSDIIRSKRAANRPKDLEVLPLLEEVLRRIRAERTDQEHDPSSA
jgi:hypothetical protein